MRLRASQVILCSLRFALLGLLCARLSSCWIASAFVVFSVFIKLLKEFAITQLPSHVRRHFVPLLGGSGQRGGWLRWRPLA